MNKKILSTILLAGMSLSLVSCTNTNDKTTITEKTDVVSENKVTSTDVANDTSKDATIKESDSTSKNKVTATEKTESSSENKVVNNKKPESTTENKVTSNEKTESTTENAKPALSRDELIENALRATLEGCPEDAPTDEAKAFFINELKKSGVEIDSELEKLINELFGNIDKVVDTSKNTQAMHYAKMIADATIMKTQETGTIHLSSKDVTMSEFRKNANPSSYYIVNTSAYSSESCPNNLIVCMTSDLRTVSFKLTDTQVEIKESGLNALINSNLTLTSLDGEVVINSSNLVSSI